MKLLSYAAAAHELNCSVSHVRNLSRAAELAAENTPPRDVPKRLRRYLYIGFPAPRFIGSRRMPRIVASALEQWIAAGNEDS